MTTYPVPEPYTLPDLPQDEANDRLRQVLTFLPYGQLDGAHHKTWVIDQLAHIVLQDDYETWVTWFRGAKDEDGYDEYTWDEGVAP